MIKYKEEFKIRTRKDSGCQWISIDGEIGVNHISRIKEKIASVNLDRKEVVIELKNAESFDLSTFQMLHSLRKSMKEQGMELTVKVDISDGLNNLMENTGISDFLKKWKNNKIIKNG